ncbi:RbsD/FucU family protein [Arcanobacterium hippocoleae]
MLYGAMTHPELLRALAAAGHGAKILIADGNYPYSVAAPPRCERISLNLAPGMLTVMDVLNVLKNTIPIEAAAIMVPAPGGPPLDPQVHSDYRNALPGVEFREIDRFRFYEEAADDYVAVLIATGDQRLYANIILTIGVRS